MRNIGTNVNDDNTNDDDDDDDELDFCNKKRLEINQVIDDLFTRQDTSRNAVLL